MKFLIPSYKRASTIVSHKTIHDLGIPISDVFIGVQTKEDLSAYRERWPGWQVSYAPADSCAKNRNNLIRAHILGDDEPFVMLDDDVCSIEVGTLLRSGKVVRRNATLAEFAWLLEEGARQSDGIWGPSATSIPLYWKSLLEKGDIDARKPSGWFVGLFGKNVRFNEAMPCLDDNEIYVRMLANGKPVRRFLRFAAKVRKCGVKNPGKIKGGCEETYMAGGKAMMHGVLKEYCVDPYPGLIAFRNNKPDCVQIRVLHG